MSCDWEGNRRSSVAMAMRHRLKWFIHLRAQGLSKRDKHPTNTPHGLRNSLPYLMRGSFKERRGFSWYRKRASHDSNLAKESVVEV